MNIHVQIISVDFYWLTFFNFAPKYTKHMFTGEISSELMGLPVDLKNGDGKLV
jgi:hypothetical protein